jgi:ADP-ribosylglycohydrolase
MADNIKAMVMASFIADSLSLGAHWIYDQKKIRHEFGRIDKLTAPLAAGFHPNRSAGEFTHYGDQTLILLESIAYCGAFDLDHFARSWQALFADYNGYMDNATNITLTNFKKNKDPKTSGSSSTDLAGAARIVPLVYLYHYDENQLQKSIEDQTRMTHANKLVIDCALFFAITALTTLSGISPPDAIQQTTDKWFHGNPISMLVRKGLASRNEDTCKAISDFGQMCDSNAAFPGVIHLIGKFADNLSEALIENTMAGGDSAARGLLVGMVLGAYQGMRAIPSHWLSGMKAGLKIEQLLTQTDKKTTT